MTNPEKEDIFTYNKEKSTQYVEEIDISNKQMKIKNEWL